ncbi:hypothetical protein BH09PSE5_BH09PSE5_08500 [soil metagenome]
MRAHDWAATPVGTPDTWPQSLRSAISICLNSPMLGTVLWGDDLLMLYNDGYIPSMGERHPWALGRPVAEVWGAAWDQVAPPFRRAMLSGDGFSQENVNVAIVRRGRTEATVWNFSAAPIRGEQGGIVGLFNQGVEITEQVRFQRQIVSEARRHRNVLMQMPGFVGVLKGREHVYEFVNGAYERVAGMRPLVGLTVRDAFPELAGQSFHELLDRVYDTGEPFSAKAMPIALAGEAEQRFIDLLCEPMRDDQGAVTGIFVGGYDVTERLALEAALREAQTTLELRVEERTAKLQNAEEALRQSQKLDAVGQLTGGVAHDFNNLLTVIRTSVDLLKRANPDERQGRFVQSISNAVARATKLTSQLLAFARRQSLEPVVFDAGVNVPAVAEMIATIVGSRISIAVDVPDEPCLVIADPGQLDTAIVNVAVNARDAMSGVGRISIKVSKLDGIPGRQATEATPGRFVSISISDSGTGIRSEDLQKIFEPFFTTKPVGVGTGLGLSQVFGFAKQSGGDVLVESEPGHGSTFTIYLPQAATLAPPAAASPLQADHHRRVSLSGIVLMVEDNPEVATTVQMSLTELGFGSVVATSAQAALAELAKDSSRFSVVFSDVVMAGMNGIQLGYEIRRRHPTLPVVLSSGYSHVLAQGENNGFRLLPKPYALEALSKILHEVVADPVNPVPRKLTPVGSLPTKAEAAMNAESVRLAELESMNVMDSIEESAYDDLTRLAATFCGTPIALISLVDDKRQWFKSKVGLQARETPREFAFCAHAIETPDEVMVVNDASKDERFASNPLVTGHPGIRFYAGAPLVTSSGQALGTLCVIGPEPREISAKQLETLQFLAAQVIGKLEARRDETQG